MCKTQKTHTEALLSAQMGQAYGYRTNPGLNSKNRLVSSGMQKAEPYVQSARTDRTEIAAIKEQISRLTNTIDRLQNSGNYMTASLHQHQDKRIPYACFKCCAHGHYAKQCRSGGVSPVQTDTKCQLCDMFGHTAIYCAPVPLNLRGQAGRGRGRLGPQRPQNVL